METTPSNITDYNEHLSRSLAVPAALILSTGPLPLDVAIAEICANPIDILLVASPSLDHPVVPVGLQHIAVACESAGLKVGVLVYNDLAGRFDSPLLRQASFTHFMQVLPYAFAVGFSVFDHDFAHIAHLITILSNASSAHDNRFSGKVFIGGAGPTHSPGLWKRHLKKRLDTLQNNRLETTIVCGDGETCLPDFVKSRIEPGKLRMVDSTTPAILRPLTTQWQLGGTPKSLENCAHTLSSVSFESSDNSDGNGLPDILSNLLQADIEFSRGCRNACSYCAFGRLSGLRFINPHEAVDQIINHLEVGKLWLTCTDSNILFDRAWLEIVRHELKKHRIADYLSLSGFAEPHSLEKFSPGELTALARCGLRTLKIGIESTERGELSRMCRKFTDLDLLIDRVGTLTDAGVDVYINLIDFFPGWQHDWFERILPLRSEFVSKIQKRSGNNVRVRSGPFLFMSKESQPRLDGGLLTHETSIRDALCFSNSVMPTCYHRREDRLVLPFGRFGAVRIKANGEHCYEVYRKWDDKDRIDRTCSSDHRALIEVMRQELDSPQKALAALGITMVQTLANC